MGGVRLDSIQEFDDGVQELVTLRTLTPISVVMYTQYGGGASAHVLFVRFS
jgi:hypothetical protein